MPIEDKQLTIPELAKRAFLNVQQRRELEKSTQDTRAVLDNPALLAQAADEEALQKQYERETAMLESGSPPEYDSHTRNKLFRLLKHIDAEAKSTMLTHTEMERGRPSDIDRYFSWHYGPQSGDQMMLARRNILLLLDRDNDEPNFLSITRLREQVDEAHRVNSPMYRMNFDEIKWEEHIEDNLIRDMDPREWQTFLELKLLEWTKPSICKELAWTTKQYEAALEKLRQSRFTAQQEQEELRVFQELAAERAAQGVPAWLQKAIEPETQGWPLEELKALGISQEAACKALRISQTTLHKYVKYDDWPRIFRARMVNFLERARKKGRVVAVEESIEERDAERVRRTGTRAASEPSDRFQTVDEEPEDDEKAEPYFQEYQSAKK